LARDSSPCCDPTTRLEGWCCASCAVLAEKNNCNAKLPDTPPKKDNCIDKYSNCNDLAKSTKCASNYSITGTGESISEACCEACELPDTPPKKDNCIDKYSNCNDLAKSTKCDSNYSITGTGESIPEACCKACDDL
jgi:hypothetical protein